MHTIDDVLRALKARGMSEGAFLRRADINHGLWLRWKQGKNAPKPTTWSRVEREMAVLKADAKRAKA